MIRVYNPGLDLDLGSRRSQKRIEGRYMNYGLHVKHRVVRRSQKRIEGDIVSSNDWNKLTEALKISKEN